ncbi:MAG: amidophosphoribosyltransferase [Cyclobacteriaceae bacterium]|nr:amidophosphoribosyltransferase [Cyclobacteriaceae bacterium]MCH8515821.1 amidophosphoribosyltransferase [Cyclobacteriaceae bacterium]
MSDSIKHECGIVLLRLKKPLQYYIDKYGSVTYAYQKMYLLMEKQHNRGQDGVGIANIKIDVPEGVRYISRYRSIDQQPIADIFKKVAKKYKKSQKILGDSFYDAKSLQEECAFTGEVWMGHLRYGTHGKNGIEYCHPMLRQNNWRSRNLVMAGNFNMTNVDELFDNLVSLGQHPKEKADTVTVMEKIGHFLDEENQRIFDLKKEEGYDNHQISRIIADELNLRRILKRSCRDFDGGYAMVGMIGSGAAFVARDPHGIRPAYWFEDDEIVVVASEKPAIKTAFDVPYDAIKPIKPGHALIVDRQGLVAEKEFITPKEKKSCSFERIYFSRGSDPGIYRERKRLGSLLVPEVLKAINYDLENTVFSYIPNTAETSFLGMIQGLEAHLKDQQQELLLQNTDKARMELARLLNFNIRVEKLVIKDAKLRTFITDDDHRDELVAHVYDTTYELIRKQVDTVVVVDDSIVRGTTLEKSILRMLGRLEPKKIVVVSSAPQIRFPDCYGIDMSKMKEFVAFRALLSLLLEEGLSHLLEEALRDAEANLGTSSPQNQVQKLYDRFTVEQISDKIAEIIRPEGFEPEVQVVYQTVENLHRACPDHLGDWYFTGNYPTPGGHKVVNKAFINFMSGKLDRAY